MTHNSLEHIFTNMIGFVTWLPFFIPINYYKGDQVTKPIILVKICSELLCVIQGVKSIFDKVTSWPQLISKFLVASACLQCCF